MLDDPRTVRITGDDTAAVYRRADDVDADTRPDDRPVPEAYVWSNLTSGNGTRALWLLLLPFMVVNLAHWMRPAGRSATRAVRLYGLLVRLAALSLTVLLVAAVCEVALDLTAWQCAGTRACAERHTWLGFLEPGGWWGQPGRRLALAAVVPAALVALLWYLSHRTWRAYESQEPLPRPDDADTAGHATPLSRPGFWYGRRLVSRLRAAHTAAGLLTVAATVGTAAARRDHERGGPALLDAFGHLLEAALVVGAVSVVWVVCGRGRTENRLDHKIDRHLVRRLPLGSLALLVCALVYAGWSRPGWTSAGRLPGDVTFGGIAVAQGAVAVVLAVVARALYDRDAEHRCALRGLGGPAVVMLACALGGVMSGGVAQRVADWLDGTGGVLPGPPVLLTWQASVIPAVLVVVLALCSFLGQRAMSGAKAQEPAVEKEYGVEDGDPARTRAIARARAMAGLTDRAPLLLGVTSGVTLLLGAGAVVGALVCGKTPVGAAVGAYPFVEGAARTGQALGSWLIGFVFLTFVTWGRRAYKDPHARRTIGILWDVGTFWPRAAHPFAPPCYAERAVPDLTWRMTAWTRETGGRLVISGHSQGSVLAAAAAWQLAPADRGRVALLTYGSPIERLYGRWFPAHFGPDSLKALHADVDCWRNLYRLTDPIGGPVRLPDVDCAPFADPLEYGRTIQHPLPAPLLGHSDYQADPQFAHERARLLARLGLGSRRERL
ncbi:hypothetical protein ABZX85_13530 [Streptomyces sp. NPDC004539]|uniref:hypothetical protein n=1 Tax=Streptomyces sp. NPDC004539 TaxID=3154280 RepID=UPI0033A41690